MTFADVLDMYIGQSERNLHELFETARRNAPCVLFLDEIDAIGQKRSQLRNCRPCAGGQPAARRAGRRQRPTTRASSCSAATNQPWDVDTALRRPGRFDRTLLVLPPDAPAREAIFATTCGTGRSRASTLAKLAEATDGYSGADLAHLCETAAERALLDSARAAAASG